ncbi:MAG: hypothetical protein PHR51_01125 [Patescibacteria group bacterium]|nr:hypothetical protein [Patescibacteria group bacterium]
MSEEVTSKSSKTNRLATRIGKLLSHNARKGGFSTSLVYEPDEVSEKRHGSLYFVIDIGSPSALSADIAYNLIDIIKEEFYSDLELGVGESFENALKAANGELAAIAKEGEKDWMGKLNIIIAAVRDKEMHVVQRGTAEVHLLREGNLTNLSKGMYAPGETYAPEETLVNIIEGELDVSDKVIMSTSELFYYISVEKLKRLMENNTPAQATKKLATMLEQEDDINRTSVLMVEFNLPDLIAQEEETEPTENWIGEPGPVAKPKARSPLAVAMDKAQSLADALQKNEEDTEAEITDDRAEPEEVVLREEIIIDEVQEAPTKPARPSWASMKTVNIKDYTAKVDSKQVQQIGQVAWRVVKAIGTMLWALLDSIITFTTNVIRNIKKRPDGNRILLIATAVIVVAVVGVTLALSSGYSNRIGLKNAQAALAEAQQKRDAAQAALIYEDGVRARELLAEAYAAAVSATKNVRTESAASVLVAELQGQIDDVSNVSRFTDVRPLVNFDAIAPQLAGNGDDVSVNIGDIVVLGGNIYTNDSVNNKIYKYKASSSEVAIINSLVSSNKRLALTAEASDSELILFTTPPGIYSLNLVNNSLEGKALDSGDWSNAEQLIVYGDKLYFLDSATNQIYKYSPVPEGYTPIAPYFETGHTPDIAGALDFAIDGNVYVLMPGNVIKQFLGGEETGFQLKNIPSSYPAISNITHIYADAESDFYVLDAGNNRILRFDEEGVYLAQYIYDTIQNPSDMTVDQAGGFIYLSSGTEVYRLPLNKE